MKDVQNTTEKPPKITPDNHEDFNPYNCGPEDGISTFGATILVIKGCIGCSFLLLPYLMKNLGYITGTAVVIFSGIVYFHTIHSLLATKYQLSKELKKTQLSFVEVAEKTFQKSPFPLNKLHSWVQYLMYLFYSLPTTDAAFLILIASEIQRLGQRFGVNMKITYIVTAEIIPLASFCMIPKILDILVPYSSVTNILTLVLAIGTISSSMIQRKDSVPLRPFGNIYAIPECVARCIKAYCVTGLILPIEYDMKKPEKMVSVFGSLNIASLAVIMFYYSFGIILYVNYGDEVQENVLNNLPVDNYLTDGIKFMYLCSLFVTYILSFYGCFNNVWSGPLKETFAGTKYEFVMEYGLRLGINMVAYTFAVGVPNLSIIFALAGTASFIVEVALPSVLELLCVITSRKMNSWIIAKNLIIIGGSLVLFFMSLTSCIKKIIGLYSS